MADNTYQPTKVWTWDKSAGGVFAGISCPVSGPTHEKALPMGKHPLQLYSLETPSGQEITIILGELLALGVTGAEYNAWLVHISDGDQFSNDFVKVNPNSKVPALRDRTHNPSVHVFESGSILFYLAEKFGYFLPQDPAKRTGAMSWLFQLQDAASFLGGGFGHFYRCAPVEIEYAIDRFTVEAKHLLDVLDKQPMQHKFVAGDEYTIADMAIWPRFDSVMLGGIYDVAEFLDAGSYKHVQHRAKEVGEHPAMKYGRIVSRISGPLNEQLYGRHGASDFETSTEDRRQG